MLGFLLRVSSQVSFIRMCCSMRNRNFFKIGVFFEESKVGGLSLLTLNRVMDKPPLIVDWRVWGGVFDLCLKVKNAHVFHGIPMMASFFSWGRFFTHKRSSMDDFSYVNVCLLCGMKFQNFQMVKPQIF